MSANLPDNVSPALLDAHMSRGVLPARHDDALGDIETDYAIALSALRRAEAILNRHHLLDVLEDESDLLGRLIEDLPTIETVRERYVTRFLEAA